MKIFPPLPELKLTSCFSSPQSLTNFVKAAHDIRQYAMNCFTVPSDRKWMSQVFGEIVSRGTHKRGSTRVIGEVSEDVTVGFPERRH